MIALRCLGSIDLLDRAQAPATRVIAQPKRFALLAYLMLAAPRGFHRRDTLIAMFWPEADAEHARSGLRIGLSFLRRELGEDVIVTRGDDVEINRGLVGCDAIEFETALHAGELEKAASLYHGDLLPGLHVSMSPAFERWLDIERDRLRRLAINAALKLSTRAERAGDSGSAIKWLRFALDLEPDDEANVQRLITLLDGAGDRAGALRAYDSFAARMLAELDATPSSKTTALIAQIRARSASGSAATSVKPSVAAVSTAAESAVPTVASETVITPAKLRNARRMQALTTASVALLILLGSSTIYRRNDHASVAPAIAGETAPSLAVLPFENLGKSDDAYFAAGITDEISSKLSTLAGMKLIGRQSAKGYAGTTKPPRQIGQELGATYLLTGTIKWDRSRPGRNLVRIIPVLLRASDGTEMWSQPYQGDATSVFGIQDTVAERVAGELRLKISQSERRALTTRPTNNAEAYDYFLRGRNLGASTHFPPDLRRGIAFLERAVQLDPKFALAYAELGNAHLLVFWFLPDDNPHRLDMAKAAIDTALSLDSNLLAAYLANANYFYRGKFDFEKALSALKDAERLSPHDPDVLNLKGAVERRQNRWAEAIADQERAFQIDPRNDRVIDNLCGNLMWMRRYSEAEKVCNQLVAIAPDKWLGYGHLYQLAVHRGDVKSALAIARRAERLVDAKEFPIDLLDDGGWPAFLDGHLLRLMESASHGAPPPGPESLLNYSEIMLYFSVYKGERAAARQFADTILRYAPKVFNGTRVDTYAHQVMALAYAAKGDKQRWLEQADLTLKTIPISVDAVGWTSNAYSLVNSAVLAGAYDEAITRIEQLLAMPSGLSVGLLRVDPWFDGIRSDARFQRLLAANN